MTNENKCGWWYKKITVDVPCNKDADHEGLHEFQSGCRVIRWPSVVGYIKETNDQETKV